MVAFLLQHVHLCVFIVVLEKETAFCTPLSYKSNPKFVFLVLVLCVISGT